MSSVVVLAVGVALVLALPLAWRLGQGRFDPFEPIVVFALAWGVMFVVRPIAIVVRDDRDFYGVDISPTLDKAELLGLVGAVAFVVGHEARSSRQLARRLPLPPPELGPRALPYAVAVAVLGTVLLFLFLVTADGLSAIGTFFAGRSPELDEIIRGSPLYLWMGSFVVVPAALVGVAVAVRDRRPLTLATAAVLVGLALVRVVPTGDRLYVLVLAGGAVVFLYLRAQRRPGLVATAIGLAVALVASYVFFVFRYEETRNDVTSVVEAIGRAPTRVFDALTKRPDSEMAPALAGALLVIPSELPHRYGGALFGDLATRPVPRHAWSGKPQPHVLEVTERVWPVARETGNFQPNFTPLLSFYWDFGLLGAFLGLALYGWLARAVYRYLLRDPGGETTQLLYAIVLPTVVVAARTDPVFVVYHLLTMVVPLLVIAKFGSREPDPAPAATGAAWTR